MTYSIKDGYNNVVAFAKRRRIIFGLICFSILAVIIIIIAVSVSVSKKKRKSNSNENNSNTNNESDKGSDSDSESETPDICDDQYSDECLYSKMMAKQSEYPERMTWTNNDCYFFKVQSTRGCGCAGFAFILSDACFGDLPAKTLNECRNFKVGDIVRINNNSHSVIILKIESNIITIAEGNFNSSIHWGRTFKISELEANCNYIIRRNPN